MFTLKHYLSIAYGRDTKKITRHGRPYKHAFTTFRVWEPNACKVIVIGDFSEWIKDDHEMELEENGYWSATKDKVENGIAYKYLIHNTELREKYPKASTTAANLNGQEFMTEPIENKS